MEVAVAMFLLVPMLEEMTDLMILLMMLLK
jgi:hypothetical protein